MAIKFEDTKAGVKPAGKEVGGKTYVAEEPVSNPEAAAGADLPFAKPVRPDKKGPKIKNRAPTPRGKTPVA